ncbi:hypothetical protein DQ384_29995 [Sphaerisporangium album]|uniref:Bacilysin biosynthesis protein BacA n=1 Tax=Sphaerisporangium album TaxID=509200 RepID=A0A367F928_9ACTN|nr:hypothetical protein [Sphaerisporangium album]RCG26205.1 hypothetical protein DQ384_29995 [Sphaerisporangium album]
MVEDLELHTLGPTGTNCEAAARHWLRSRGADDTRVELHPTLEDAVTAVLADPDRSALLACVVYPDLHNIVFGNLDSLALRDCFVMPTHSMVLASRGGEAPRTVASHAAPVSLIDHMDVRIRLVDSNAQAALDCAAGEVDACVTTSVAAEAAGLTVLKDFGPVPMGFSVHAPHEIEV